uniref:Si:ch73-379j16.2 n=1 Tax=Hippocampus comes TaxID=109280 RepID=A0A3Q2Z268_HIPCM
MGAAGQRRGLFLCIIVVCLEQIAAQIKYSIAEEVKVGTVVGNVARDLGLDVGMLVERRFRIVSGTEEAHFEVNVNNGVLFVRKTVNREELCESVSPCLVNLKLVAENPMEIHHVGLEIIDINDNAPTFQEVEKILEIPESTLPGKRFQLPNANDPDVVVNTVRAYKLSMNEYFDIQIRNRGDDKIPFLVLQKSLDREKDTEHRLVLTAVDGGNPARSGSLNVTVIVLDSNDNHPIFKQEVYSVNLSENVKLRTGVIKVEAIDLDEGISGEVEYYFGGELDSEIYETFSLDKNTGEISVKGQIDFEKADVYKLDVHATDKGQPPMSTDCRVIIKIVDENDNQPEIDVTSLSKTVAEDSKPGTVIALISITDKDVGLNGKVICRLSQNVPFELKPSFQDNMYSLALKDRLDRELVADYDITITATDCGQPPLSTFKILHVDVDINDNAPQIEVTSLSNSVAEDSKPGSVISLISVKDKDSGVNGKVIATIINPVPFELKPSYKENIFSVVTKDYLDREEVSHYEITIKSTDCGEPPLSAVISLNIQISDVNDNCPRFEQNPLEFYLAENNVAGNSVFYVSATDKDINGNAAISYHIVREERLNDIMSFLNINAENGQISALKSFDFETLKSFQFHVVATDGGSPPLSSNVTVKVFILDQNDNAPVILYPVSSNGSAEGVEEIPRNLKPGDLVTKVRAYDIRTLRSFTETDEAEHRLLILVKDNGNISLSATATVTVKLVEPKEAFAASDIKSAAKVDEEDNVTFYLIITLGSVSLLFVISIIVLIAMQCSKSTEYTSKYLQDANYDGTLCHSIQYRSGDKRYMLVGPRRSIGPPVVPGSHANTLVLPDRRHTSGEVRQTFFFSFLLKAHTKHNSSCIQSARMVLPKGWRRFPSEPMTPISDIHSRQQRL